jgi:lysophospholipase L1-like esterase
MDVRGKRVFILGDSLSVGDASPGGQLASQLLQAGARTVRVQAKSGRSAHSFFSEKAPSAQSILTGEVANNPDIVIVMLGTNDMGLNMAVDAAQMAKIKNAFPKADVWAIGPPTLPRSPTKAAEVVAMMRRVFPLFLDWRPLSADIVTAAQGRSPDQVHFAAAGARLSGQRLAAALLAKSNGMGFVVKLALGALVLGVAGISAYAIAKRSK